MNIVVFIVLAGCAALTFLAGAIQGLVAWHSADQKLQRRLRPFMIGCIILTVALGFASYFSLPSIQGPTTTLTATVTSSSPTSNPTAPPKGTILYNADWSKGNDQWNITNEWNTTDGILVNNGNAGSNSIILAPIKITTANYVVDAHIEIPNNTGIYDFGIIVGSDGNHDGYACYMFGSHNGPNGSVNITDDLSVLYPDLITPLQSHLYQVDANWHTYRVEVRGVQITFLIDNQQLLQISSSNSSSVREVGLIDARSVINVSSFKVTSL
jgi:hypothetical protein